jgi:hypothetical protein
VAALALRDVLRRALRDDFAAAVAAFGARGPDPVGGLDDLEVVLDHHDGVALVDELVQHLISLATSWKCRPGRRLVEDVERAAGGALRQLLRELDALRLAARQGRRLLADMDVVEADAGERLPSSRGSTGTALNSSRASSTVMSSTSAMDFSR